MSERRRFFRELGAVAREARRATAPPRPDPDPDAAGPRSGSDELVLAPPDGDRLDAEERERYSRQLVLPEWSEAAQLALRRASVLVVGTGALGSPVATYLAGAGVGRIGLLDDEAVERSNLARQVRSIYGLVVEQADARDSRAGHVRRGAPPQRSAPDH